MMAGTCFGSCLLADGLVCPASQKSLYLPEVGGVSCFRTEVLSKLFHLPRRKTVGTKLMGMCCMDLMVKIRDEVI